jgi:hypothetical protein
MLVTILEEIPDYGAGAFKPGLVVAADPRCARIWIARGQAKEWEPEPEQGLPEETRATLPPVDEAPPKR